MTDSMSKKEKLARGSAVIKVQKVIPRAGHFLKSYIDVYKMPKKPKPPIVGKPPPMALQEMPHLDIKAARFEVVPKRARIDAPPMQTKLGGGPIDLCGLDVEEEDQTATKGLPEGHYLLKSFGYREWAKTVHPTQDQVLADHFNGLLGLLISMAKDEESNENFPEVEAYPCIQFLRTVKTPDGEYPSNVASFIQYMECICNKIIEEA